LAVVVGGMFIHGVANNSFYLPVQTAIRNKTMELTVLYDADGKIIDEVDKKVVDLKGSLFARKKRPRLWRIRNKKEFNIGEWSERFSGT
jgi:hypothetical protein